MLYSDFVDQDTPAFVDLTPSLNRVFDLSAGRGRTMVDSFVEAIVSASLDWTGTYKWTAADDGVTNFAVFGIDIYCWHHLADEVLGRPQGCIGLYRINK